MRAFETNSAAPHRAASMRFTAARAEFAGRGTNGASSTSGPPAAVAIRYSGHGRNGRMRTWDRSRPIPRGRSTSSNLTPGSVCNTWRMTGTSQSASPRCVGVAWNPKMTAPSRGAASGRSASPAIGAITSGAASGNRTDSAGVETTSTSSIRLSRRQ